MVNDRSLEQMTLREKFTGAERLARELIEHLEQGFLPKTADLQKLVRPHGPGEQLDEALQDAAIRNSAARLAASEDFTQRLFERLENYCAAIDREVHAIVNGG